MNIFDIRTHDSSIRIASAVINSIISKSFSILWNGYISSKLPPYTIQNVKEICTVISGLTHLTHDALIYDKVKSEEPNTCVLYHKVSTYTIRFQETPKHIERQNFINESKPPNIDTSVIRPSSRLQSVLYDVDDGRIERVDVDKAIREQVGNRERIMEEAVYKLLGKEKANSIKLRKQAQYSGT